MVNCNRLCTINFCGCGILYNFFLVLHVFIYLAALALAITMNAQDRFGNDFTREELRRAAISACYILPIFLVIPALIAESCECISKCGICCLCDAARSGFGLFDIVQNEESAAATIDTLKEQPATGNSKLWDNEGSFKYSLMVEFFIWILLFPVLSTYGVNEYWMEVGVSNRTSRIFTALYFFAGIMPFISMVVLVILHTRCCCNDRVRYNPVGNGRTTMMVVP